MCSPSLSHTHLQHYPAAGFRPYWPSVPNKVSPGSQAIPLSHAQTHTHASLKAPLEKVIRGVFQSSTVVFVHVYFVSKSRFVVQLGTRDFPPHFIRWHRGRRLLALTYPLLSCLASRPFFYSLCELSANQKSCKMLTTMTSK